MFSGLLDEGAVDELTASIASEPSVEEDVVRDLESDLESDLLGGALDLEQGSSAAESLSELIKTKAPIPHDQITTVPPVSVSGPIANQRIEVPVTIELDGSVDDAEQVIELLLKIRLKRK